MVWNWGHWLPEQVGTRQVPGLGAMPELRGAEGRTDPTPSTRSCTPRCRFEWLRIKWLKSWVAGEERGKRVTSEVLPVFGGGDTLSSWPGLSYAWVVVWCVRQCSVPPTPSKAKSVWTSVKTKHPNSDGPIQISYFKIRFLCSLTKKKPKPIHPRPLNVFSGR